MRGRRFIRGMLSRLFFKSKALDVTGHKIENTANDVNNYAQYQNESRHLIMMTTRGANLN